MEFWHYYNSTPVSGIIPLKLELYPVTATWDFSPNTASDFSYEEIADSASYVNSTCIFTFTKNRSNSEILLSSFQDGGGGFTLGSTAGNHLYIDCHSPRSETYIYDDITLGQKNCLVFKRTEQSFSIYQYDLLSRALTSRQTISFSPDAILNSANDILIGGHSVAGYSSKYGNGNIKFFNGSFDQFVYLSGAVEDAYLLSVLSGFLPLTKTQSSSSTYGLLDESYRFPEGYYENGYSNFSSYFSGANSFILTGMGNGKWIGTGVGRISSGGMTGSIGYQTGIDACYGTGNYYSFTYTGAGTGAYTSFVDTVRVNRNALTTISHNLTLSRAGISNFHIDYDASYKLETTTGASFSEDLSYYTGFKMDGVVSETIRLMALATDTGIAPTGYNINGVYDNFRGLFSLPGWSPGRFYYNGTGALTYVKTGVYIDISGFTEISTDYLIGDNNNSSTLLYYGTDNWATGQFYSNAAFVTRSAAPLGRAKTSEYKETSTYHLYHQSPIQPTGTTFLFKL